MYTNFGDSTQALLSTLGGENREDWDESEHEQFHTCMCEEYTGNEDDRRGNAAIELSSVTLQKSPTKLFSNCFESFRGNLERVDNYQTLIPDGGQTRI